MCWAVPAKVIETDGEVGRVEVGGTEREVGMRLLEDVEVGDYVLVHAGFAIQRVDQQEALKTLELFEKMHEALQREQEGRG